MPKKYLNRTEKETVLIVSTFIAYLDALSKEKLTKPMLKWLRSSKTFAYKLTDEYMAGIDETQMEQIQRDTAKMKVHVRYPHEKRDDKEEKFMPMDDFSKLCELVSDVHCKGCGGSGVSCSTRDLFLRCGLDVVNEEGCPYRC